MHQGGAFLSIPRQSATSRPVAERLRDFREVEMVPQDAAVQQQALRCMNCGVPFCHWRCPAANYIPLWNDHLANGRWFEAYRLLQATNNIPEITGRICPALCESSCVLGLVDDPVTIRDNELAIIEHAFAQGWVTPRAPSRRTGTSVAVVGSGPAGLCCAAQLNQAGHRVVVFERDDQLGGMLRYGIPDFKLDKRVLDRRLALWRREGVEFVTNATVGWSYPTDKLRREFDAVCLTGGSRVPRDLPVEGRQLRGVHFAMDYLAQSNRRVGGEIIRPMELIEARDQQVVVLGGGDTGADCVGTALRQRARHIVQLELLPRPPARRSAEQPWPDVPTVLKTSSSHDEGGARLERRWAVQTKRFLGREGRVTGLACVEVAWNKDAAGALTMRERPDAAFELSADLVLLALGFVRPQHEGLINDLRLEVDSRGNVQANAQHMTSVPGIFVAGDMRRGQSLIVWAVSEGRRAAHFIDRYLMGSTRLPLL